MPLFQTIYVHLCTPLQKYKTTELRAQSLKEELDKLDRERKAVEKQLEENQNELREVHGTLEMLRTRCDELQRLQRTTQLEKEEITSQVSFLSKCTIITFLNGTSGCTFVSDSEGSFTNGESNVNHQFNSLVLFTMP